TPTAQPWCCKTLRPLRMTARMHGFSRTLGGFLGGVVLLAGAVGSGLADSRDFDFVNGSATVLTHLFVSPSDADFWEEDILGRDELGPGEMVTVSVGQFDQSICLYDVKVVAQDGTPAYLYKVDLCG